MRLPKYQKNRISGHPKKNPPHTQQYGRDPCYGKQRDAQNCAEKSVACARLFVLLSRASCTRARQVRYWMHREWDVRSCHKHMWFSRERARTLYETPAHRPPVKDAGARVLLMCDILYSCRCARDPTDIHTLVYRFSARPRASLRACRADILFIPVLPSYLHAALRDAEKSFS